MKESQPKLSVGFGGNILIDSTNRRVHKPNESIPKKRKIVSNENNVPSTKKLRGSSVFCDPVTVDKVKKFSNASVQTDDLKNVAKSMENYLTADAAPEEYWQQLAESRRKQIEKLMKEKDDLRAENEYLKGDIKSLEEMVEEAKILAKLVDEVTNAPDDDC